MAIAIKAEFIRERIYFNTREEIPYSTAVVMEDRKLCLLDEPALAEALKKKTTRFHRGTIGGAWPVFP